MRILAVTNIYPTPHRPALGTFIEQQVTSLRHHGVEVDVFFLDRARLGMRSYGGLGRQVRARLTASQPDIVHVMYGGIMADVVTRVITDRPTVVSFCGSDLYGEHLSGYLRKVIAGYGVLASHRAAQRATGVIVKSKLLREKLPRTLDQSKVRIIPNGVDLDQFQPLDQQRCQQRLGWERQHLHVLFPANSGDPVKRPQLARAAVERVAQCSFPVEFHELRGVPHQTVRYWLNASDVVLLTSRHEGSPNIVKEALACNIPIVSVTVGDVPERIAGISGCYLADPEPNDLAAKLQLVFTGSRRVAGRPRMQDLSLDTVAARLCNFYDDILQRHQRPTGFSHTA
ncbi:MAG: glycosyltransferase [Candidatus Binatia bacterium]